MSETSVDIATHSTQTAETENAVRKIIHVDMDAFYASVEQRDNPALRGFPVIVGGKPDGRGVVAACSYEARQFGVHSAMPSAEAGRRCPDAIFVKPRFSAYQQVSRQVQAVFYEFTDMVEPLSLDEAYLDVSASTVFDGSAVRLAREIKSLIHERTGLVASAGVSYNKFLAKIASDYDKPDGLYCILPEQGEAFVAQLAVGRIHGVGKVTEARMHDLGIRSGSDLRLWTLDELAHEFGKSSHYYYWVARGVDHRPVRISRTRKSMGSERTFGQNIQSRDEMLDVLNKLADELLDELSEKMLTASTLSVKVRFADFSTYTRAHSEAPGLMDVVATKRTIPFLLDRALASVSQENRVGQRFRSNRSASEGVRLLGISFRGLATKDEQMPVQLQIDC